jgi:predicted PurR-regulated permease PerM
MSGLYTRKRIGEAALLLMTGLAFYLCWLLAEPFLAALTWALALAVVGHPLHRLLEKRLPPEPAAFVAVLAVLLVLLAPGVFLVQQGVSEVPRAFDFVADGLNPIRLREALGQNSSAAWLLQQAEGRFDLPQELRRLAGAVAGQTPAALSGSIQFVTQFSIMLLVLFFFFRDRVTLLASVGRLIPLSADETAGLFARISQTIYATLYGNVVVKLIQGLLGGLMFWFLGLPAPVPFGLAFAVASVLPLVGTAFIWAPAAIWLLVHGSWVKALIMVLWGGLVVGLIDNVLYPVLVGAEVRIHPLGVMLSLFGGLIVFGIAGVVLGPVILACTVALLEVWTMRTRLDDCT